MKAKELLVEFYDPQYDELSMYNYDDTRRPRLTLSKIRKMRQTRDFERVDKQDHLNFLPTMYGPVGDEDF